MADKKTAATKAPKDPSLELEAELVAAREKVAELEQAKLDLAEEMRDPAR